MIKKRHHYVPKTYLDGFVNEHGYLWVGRKDEPETPFLQKPDSVAFHKHYYSQSLPNGNRDNRMEDFFGNTESEWPDLRRKLANSERLTPDNIGLLWLMLGTQRVRVPAARDMVEDALAHDVMLALRQMDQAGELLPYPEGVPAIMDKTRVSIDPQKSIEVMSHMLKAFQWLIGRIGFQVIHNDTPINFVTSDNPVSIFDSSVPEKVMRPYVIDPNCTSIELLFPVNSKTLIRGHSTLHDRFSVKGPKHVRLKDEAQICRMNRLTARFAYELLIADDASHARLLKAFADKSPVLENSVGWKGGEPLGPLIMSFGERPQKAKWRP